MFREMSTEQPGREDVLEALDAFPEQAREILSLGLIGRLGVEEMAHVVIGGSFEAAVETLRRRRGGQVAKRQMQQLTVSAP